MLMVMLVIDDDFYDHDHDTSDDSNDGSDDNNKAVREIMASRRRDCVIFL